MNSKAEYFDKYTDPVTGNVDILAIFDEEMSEVRDNPERYTRRPSEDSVAAIRAAMARDLAKRDVTTDPVTKAETDAILSLVFAALAVSTASNLEVSVAN